MGFNDIVIVTAKKDVKKKKDVSTMKEYDFESKREIFRLLYGYEKKSW